MSNPEHNVSGESPRIHEQGLWTRYSLDDASSSEVELGDFLYGLVRILKPRIVVETGFHRGHTSLRLHSGVIDNGMGTVIACDPIPPKDGRLAGLEGLKSKTIDVRPCNSYAIKDEIGLCDLLFSDSDPYIRLEEVSWLKGGAVAVVHDTYVYPFLGEFVKSQGGILFDTPRGFGVIRK